MARYLRNKDVLAGLVFLLLAGIVIYGAMDLQLGTSLRMGPGYFPLVLSGCLVLLALLTIAGGVRNATEENAVAPLAWSRLLIVTASVFVFIVGLRGLGFPITVFLTVFIASAASRDFKLVTSILLSAIVTAGAWLIFVWSLGLPFQALGTWLA
ncbi:MAG TPA: tripartite tricarboxylate transporter TctB family protein [Pseudorhizobium sp.]|nr:tripartite tricarboxylate transporter TctB family protein [Pseudorhizobium sp.]